MTAEEVKLNWHLHFDRYWVNHVKTERWNIEVFEFYFIEICWIFPAIIILCFCLNLMFRIMLKLNYDFSLAPSVDSFSNHKYDLWLYLLFAGNLVAKALLCAGSMESSIHLIWFVNPKLVNTRPIFISNNFVYESIILWFHS